MFALKAINISPLTGRRQIVNYQGTQPSTSATVAVLLIASCRSSEFHHQIVIAKLNNRDAVEKYKASNQLKFKMKGEVYSELTKN